MVNKEFRDALNAYLNEIEEEATLLENPAFDNSIVGVSSDYKIIYDYDKMVQELAEDENMELIDAEDFISYDTMRAIPYFPNPPIIMDMSRERILDLYGKAEVEKNEK